MVRRRQGKKTNDKAGIRAVAELQLEIKTIQVRKKILRTFIWSQNERIQTMFTSRLTLALYTDGRKGVLEDAGGKQHITRAAPNELKLSEVG